MKIAICISGIARGQVKHNIGRMKEAFGDKADIFTASWRGHKNDLTEQYNAKYYDEPAIHYNPWKDCVTDNPHPKYKAYKQSFIDKTEISQHPKLLNATKQLIAHAYHLPDIPEEYDMIIRVRWDTVVSIKLDFTKYLEQSYNENIAVGFAIRGGRHAKLDEFKNIDHVYVTEDTDQMWSRDWCYWLNDNMIFHPRKLYDCNKVLQYHEEKKLWPAEYGWYQMLSNTDNHHGVYGGAVIEKFWR